MVHTVERLAELARLDIPKEKTYTILVGLAYNVRG